MRAQIGSVKDRNIDYHPALQTNVHDSRIPQLGMGPHWETLHLCSISLIELLGDSTFGIIRVRQALIARGFSRVFLEVGGCPSFDLTFAKMGCTVPYLGAHGDFLI
jgi:hypothetical protein